MRLVKIGNVNEFDALAQQSDFRPTGGGGRGLRSLQLGQRVKRLTSQALDRGEKGVSEFIDEQFPGGGGGGGSALGEELPPEAQEELAQGLDLAIGALRGSRGSAARKARAILAGLYDSLGSAAADAGGFGSVDAIGLQPHDGPRSGGLMRDDEWR